MECEKVREKLPDYLMDSLDELSGTAIRSHWNTCQSCREEAESLEGVWAKLGTLPSEEPTPRVRARFEAMLEAYEEGLANAHPGPRWHEALNDWIAGWWPRQPLVQVASAMALLIVGLVAGAQFVGSEPPGGGDLIALQGEVQSLRQLVALSMLDQQSATQRLRGVNWSSQITQPAPEVLSTLLSTLNHDPNVNVRLAVIDALMQSSNAPGVRDGIIEALGQQDSPLVQISIINGLVELREQRAVLVFEQLKENGALHESVRERAEWGLQQLSL